MKPLKYYTCTMIILTMISCSKTEKQLNVEVFETASNGNHLTRITEFPSEKSTDTLTLLPGNNFQTITGFGGSFTEASASLINRLSTENRKKIMIKYMFQITVM